MLPDPEVARVLQQLRAARFMLERASEQAGTVEASVRLDVVIDQRVNLS